MKNQIRNILIAVLGFTLLITISCKKSDTLDNFGAEDYIVFGVSAGNCISDCVQIFKLTKTAVYRDDHASYVGAGNFQNYLFNPVYTLSDSRFKGVEALITSVPSELHNGRRQVIGCPDCADAGAVYIELQFNGVNTRFLLDGADSTEESQVLKSFKQQILDAIGKLRN